MSLYGIVKDIVIGGWRLFQNYHDRQNKDEVEKNPDCLKKFPKKD